MHGLENRRRLERSWPDFGRYNEKSKIKGPDVLIEKSRLGPAPKNKESNGLNAWKSTGCGERKMAAARRKR